MMRETFGNMLFFTTYETTRYYFFGALGLDPNRARAARKDETVPARPMVTNTLLEAGVGIVTGGLAGVAVSELLTNKLLGFLTNADLSKFFHHLLPIFRPSFAHDLSIMSTWESQILCHLFLSFIKAQVKASAGFKF